MKNSDSRTRFADRHPLVCLVIAPPFEIALILFVLAAALTVELLETCGVRWE